MERIDDGAFYDAEIDRIELPSTLEEIGDYAFSCSLLVSVELPDSLETIGANAFMYCSDLREVTFGADVDRIGAEAFSYCDLTSLRLLENVRYIGQKAFFEVEGLEGLELPDSLEYVGQDAFGLYDSTRGLYATGSDTLRIPAYLEHIGRDAFSGLDITGFDVDADNPQFSAEGPLLMSKDGSLVITCAARAAGEFRVPESATAIAFQAFQSAPEITDVYIPDSVTRIASSILYLDYETHEYRATIHCSPDSAAARYAQAEELPWVADEA